MRLRGVDKRIDQLSLIIKHGGTVYDLVKLEHAYAPPFSAAKDAIAIAGYAACNIINGSMPVIYWRELRDMDRKDVFLLDVRTESEFALGNIDGAVNIPVDDLRDRINEVPKDKRIVIYCAVGLRGYVAQRILLGRGFENVVNLSGGYKSYELSTQLIVNAPVEEDIFETDDCKCGGDYHMETLKLDACGLSCPGPIMKLKQAVDGINPGCCVEVKATDAGFPRDAEAWCRTTGNRKSVV